MSPSADLSETPQALVMGTGRMARLRAARLREAGLRVSITSRDIGRAREAAAGLQAIPVPYADALNGSYQCVLVTSASEDHFADVSAVVSRTPIVLCEKPVATDLDQAKLLRRMAEAAGCEVFVGFQRRFDPALSALRAKVRRGDFGTLLHVRASDFDREVGSADFIAKSGGMFKDLVIHDLDWITWTTGATISTVHAFGSVLVSPDYRAAGDCEVATVSLVLDDGTLATVNSSRSHPAGQDVRVELLGTSAAMSVGLTERTPLQPEEGGQSLGSAAPPQDFMERFADAFRRETDQFAAHVVNHTEPFGGCTLDEAIAALTAAEACDLSWTEQRTVRL